MKWQLIRALQMFVEHVVLKHEGMLPYARRLNLVRFRWLTLICVACRVNTTVQVIYWGRYKTRNGIKQNGTRINLAPIFCAVHRGGRSSHCTVST